MVFIAIGIGIALLLIAMAFIRSGADDTAAAAQAEQYDYALTQENSAVGRLLIRTGRLMAGSKYLLTDTESPAYNNLRLKLTAAGGMYASSPTVYMSVQIAAGLISAALFAVMFFAGQSGLLLIVGALLAGALVYYPYQRINEAISKRSSVVDQDLPEFAELLLMPLSGGYGIIPALDFTAQRLDGPVSHEVRVLLSAINSGVGSDADLFRQAGERLGTPAARAFFASLAQAYEEGTTVVESLRGQADQLRKIAYEQTREKLKVLPNKLVLIMGLHLMPALFVVVLLPVVFAWSGGIQ